MERLHAVATRPMLVTVDECDYLVRSVKGKNLHSDELQQLVRWSQMDDANMTLICVTNSAEVGRYICTKLLRTAAAKLLVFRSLSSKQLKDVISALLGSTDQLILPAHRDMLLEKVVRRNKYDQAR